MNIEEIIDLVYEILLEYNLGSDSPRICFDYDKKVVRYISTTYEWYEIPSKEDPMEVLKNCIRCILEHTFELDYYKV